MCVCVCVCVFVCVCVCNLQGWASIVTSLQKNRVYLGDSASILYQLYVGAVRACCCLALHGAFMTRFAHLLEGGGACNRVNFDIPAARRSEERALKRIQVISCYCVCLRLFVSLCVCVCVCAYASLLLLLLSLSRTAPSLLLLPLSRSWRSRKSKPLQKLRPTRSASLLHARTLALRCVHIVALPLQGSNQPVLSLTHTLTHTHTHTLSLYLSISLSTSPFIPSFLPFLTPNLLLLS